MMIIPVPPSLGPYIVIASNRFLYGAGGDLLAWSAQFE